MKLAMYLFTNIQFCVVCLVIMLRCAHDQDMHTVLLQFVSMSVNKLFWLAR